MSTYGRLNEAAAFGINVDRAENGWIVYRYSMVHNRPMTWVAHDIHGVSAIVSEVLRTELKKIEEDKQ